MNKPQNNRSTAIHNWLANLCQYATRRNLKFDLRFSKFAEARKRKKIQQKCKTEAKDLNEACVRSLIIYIQVLCVYINQ
ncbi:hypothetical protein ACET3Z_024103 [Daucus carota]